MNIKTSHQLNKQNGTWFNYWETKSWSIAFGTFWDLSAIFRRDRRRPSRGVRQLQHQQRHLHAHPRGHNQVRELPFWWGFSLIMKSLSWLFSLIILSLSLWLTNEHHILAWDPTSQQSAFPTAWRSKFQMMTMVVMLVVTMMKVVVKAQTRERSVLAINFHLFIFGFQYPLPIVFLCMFWNNM